MLGVSADQHVENILNFVLLSFASSKYFCLAPPTIGSRFLFFARCYNAFEVAEAVDELDFIIANLYLASVGMIDFHFCFALLISSRTVCASWTKLPIVEGMN